MADSDEDESTAPRTAKAAALEDLAARARLRGVKRQCANPQRVVLDSGSEEGEDDEDEHEAHWEDVAAGHEGESGGTHTRR